jgi:rhodanese-related sulfurtransferase
LVGANNLSPLTYLKPEEELMTNRVRILWVVTGVLICLAVNAMADPTIPARKQTSLGLYITAQEAYEAWRKNPEEVKIVDVRTVGEYVFVGHAPMAVNIPLLLLEPEKAYYAKKPQLPLNAKFVEEFGKRYKKTDTLMVICRSGGRSAVAANILAKAGYKNAHTVIDGFEGDKLKVEGSYNNGKRVVNGWKNSGAPWTYDLDPALVYRPGV